MKKSSEQIKNYWNKLSSGDINGHYNPDNINDRFDDVSEIIKNPEMAFPTEIRPLIRKYMGDLNGKKVCVPSSGDNRASFGFYLLGAKVTSCDLSENILKNAKIIADRYNWAIEFICQDSMKLDKIKNGKYDLVYTSNGVHVWIDDLSIMYKNFNRILKRGGYNIFFDTHPICRPFDDSTANCDMKVKKSYEDIISSDKENIPRYHWRIYDFINAIISSGFTIKEMKEFYGTEGDLDDYLENTKDPENPDYGIDMHDWKHNPWAALPQCLCLCSQKS